MVIVEAHRLDWIGAVSGPTNEMRRNEIGGITWQLSHGSPTAPLFSIHCHTFDKDFAWPPRAFWNAVMNDKEWMSYRLEFSDNVEKARCFCDPQLTRLARLLRAIHGQDWQEIIPILRPLASELLEDSLRARVEAMNKKREAKKVEKAVRRQIAMTAKNVQKAKRELRVNQVRKAKTARMVIDLDEEEADDEQEDNY